MTRDKQLEIIRAACVAANPRRDGPDAPIGDMAHGGVVRLADVLLAVDEQPSAGAWNGIKYGIRADGQFLTDFGEKAVWVNNGTTSIEWNLRADDLTQQSPECVAFLADLLAHTK